MGSTATARANYEAANAFEDAEYVRFHTLVMQEFLGTAPEGTADLLAEDPYRWAAHLGVAVERVERRRGRDDVDEYQLDLIRDGLLARKGDVVAIRRRTDDAVAAHHARKRVARLLATLHRIIRLTERGTADEVREVADAALNHDDEAQQ